MAERATDRGGGPIHVHYHAILVRVRRIATFVRNVPRRSYDRVVGDISHHENVDPGTSRAPCPEQVLLFIRRVDHIHTVRIVSGDDELADATHAYSEDRKSVV